MSEKTKEVFIGGTEVKVVAAKMEDVTVRLPPNLIKFRNKGDAIDKYRDAGILESAVGLDESLKEVDDGMQEGRELHNIVDRANWCVTLDDLKELETLVKKAVENGLITPKEDNFDPKDMEKGPDIRTVNEQFIKRITKLKGGMSWALMKHPEGKECDLFITHSWEEGIFEFLSKVIDSWPRGAHHAYCCMLANPQNLNIAHLLTEPSESPFAKSLDKAKKMMVVPNSSSSIYTRLWCAYEAYRAYVGKKFIFTARPPVREGVAYRLGVVAVFAAWGWARRSNSRHHGHVDYFLWASPFVFLLMTLLSNRTSTEKYVYCCAGAHDAFYVVAACCHQWWDKKRSKEEEKWFQGEERWTELESVEVLGMIYLLFGIYFFISITDLVSAKNCKTASDELKNGYRNSVRHAKCTREEDKIAIYREMNKPRQEEEPAATRQPAEDGGAAQEAGGREKEGGGPPAESSGCGKSATTHEVAKRQPADDGGATQQVKEEDGEEDKVEVNKETVVAVDAMIRSLIDAGLSTKNMWEAHQKKVQLHEVAYVQWAPTIVSLIWTGPFFFNFHAGDVICAITRLFVSLDLGVAACLAVSLPWMDRDRRAIAVACLQKVHMFIPFLAILPSGVAYAVKQHNPKDREKVLEVLFMLAAGMGLLAKLCCARLFRMDLKQLIETFGPEIAQALVTYGFAGMRGAFIKIWQSLRSENPSQLVTRQGATEALRAASSSLLHQQSGALQRDDREMVRWRRPRPPSRQDEGVELVRARSLSPRSGESGADPGFGWEELIREIKFNHAQDVRVENDELMIDGLGGSNKKSFQILLPRPSSGRSRVALLLIHGSSRGGAERHRGLAMHLAQRLGVVVLMPVDACSVDDAVVFATWLQWRADVDANSLVLGGFRDGGVLAFEAAAKLRDGGAQPAAAVLLLDAVPRRRWLASSLAGELSDAPAHQMLLLRPRSSWNFRSLFTPRSTQLPQWGGERRFTMVEVYGARHADVEAAGDVDDSGEASSSSRPRKGARAAKAEIFQALIDAFLREVFPLHTAPREGDAAPRFSSVREVNMQHITALNVRSVPEVRG